ncbi:hypothetical protein BE221DRAFT_204440 [Ostreococcus tauri]|uniref:Uncharacterized protein n=1 Tax=Ostreococcus tauri TaxID=70448 RepID=A0A1Y5ICB1_OSTTA|nr:hypothetical protein BE221DRAFT_204440 [Ostreococcus tauri]
MRISADGVGTSLIAVRRSIDALDRIPTPSEIIELAESINLSSAFRAFNSASCVFSVSTAVLRAFTFAAFISHACSSSTTLRIFFILDFAADKRFACILRSLFSSSVDGSRSARPLVSDPVGSSSTEFKIHPSASTSLSDFSRARIVVENPV